MKFSKKIKTLLVCFLMIGGTALAQITEQQKITISDDELGKFASIFQGIQLINTQGQQDMMKVIEANGFEVNRFNELYEASQTDKKEANITVEEKEKFGTVMNEIQKKQAGLQKQMEDVITKEGLTLDRYQQVATALQTNTELQQRLQALLVKEQQ